MNLDREMTETKLEEHDDIYNFVVDSLSIWNHLRYQNSIYKSHILKFIFLNCPMNTNEEISKTKVIDCEETYNFIVDNLSVWNHLECQNSVWISHILKLKFFKLSKRIQKEKWLIQKL